MSEKATLRADMEPPETGLACQRSTVRPSGWITAMLASVPAAAEAEAGTWTCQLPPCDESVRVTTGSEPVARYTGTEYWSTFNQLSVGKLRTVCVLASEAD